MIVLRRDHVEMGLYIQLVTEAPPVDRSADFPLGAALSLAQLETSPYASIAALHEHEPVTWLPALGGWFVTNREVGIQVMRDAHTFTVDDPRFTTAAVLGPSMLSLDGPDHSRHRSPFAPAFRPQVVRDQFETFLTAKARQLVENVASVGQAELRTTIAGPLAVAAIVKFLGLVDVSDDEVLRWYTGIAQAIVALTSGDAVADRDAAAIRALRRQVDHTLLCGDEDSLLRKVQAQGELQPQELTSAAAVLMFGAIETAEGMTANAMWHLLSNPGVAERVRSDRTLLPALIEESLRLEPAAAFIDRYSTRESQLGSVTIPAGDLVTVSLLGANRDPSVFDDPDTFDVDRDNSRQHVTFVQGPHACIGLHLARMETTKALEAALDGFPELRLDRSSSTAPAGLIFRKPNAIHAEWLTPLGRSARLCSSTDT